MAYVLAGHGKLFVAQHLRVEKDDRGSQVVMAVPKYDGGTFERSMMFDDVDRDTGRQTDASRDVAALESGTWTAYSITTRVSKAGKPYDVVVGAEPMVEVTLSDEAAAASGSSRPRSNGSK